MVIPMFAMSTDHATIRTERALDDVGKEKRIDT